MHAASGIELAATPVRQETRWEVEQHIVFMLAGATYAVPLAGVQEVEHVPAITAVPFSPPWVRGIVNLRGTILTLVDLATLLDLGTWQVTRDARILIARADEPVALGVDSLLGMRRIPVTDRTPLDGALDGRVASFLTGIYRGEDELYGVLDLPRLLQAAELEADGATTTLLRSPLAPTR